MKQQLSIFSSPRLYSALIQLLLLLFFFLYVFIHFTLKHFKKKYNYFINKRKKLSYNRKSVTYKMSYEQFCLMINKKKKKLIIKPCKFEFFSLHVFNLMKINEYSYKQIKHVSRQEYNVYRTTHSSMYIYLIQTFITWEICFLKGWFKKCASRALSCLHVYQYFYILYIFAQYLLGNESLTAHRFSKLLLVLNL